MLRHPPTSTLFPTRRSSDLPVTTASPDLPVGPARPARQAVRARRVRRATRATRSEEHTSELQSLTNLVCRLLLEKKKKNKNIVKAHNELRGRADDETEQRGE